MPPPRLAIRKSTTAKENDAHSRDFKGFRDKKKETMASKKCIQKILSRAVSLEVELNQIKPRQAGKELTSRGSDDGREINKNREYPTISPLFRASR